MHECVSDLFCVLPNKKQRPLAGFKKFNSINSAHSSFVIYTADSKKVVLQKPYSQNTRTFPLPVLKLVLYFSSIASISETSSVILQLLQKPYDHNMNIVHIYDTVV